MEDRMRVAAVGVGRMGFFHALHVQEHSQERGDSELVAVVDRFEDLAAQVAARLQPGQESKIHSFTSVEDLLDSVTTGFNVHAGVEYPVLDHLRIYGLARYELMEDLRYLEFRMGLQVMFVGPTLGEERSN